MNQLDLDLLFYTCPYPVKYDGDEYTFRTDHDIVYAVDFKEEQSFAPIPAEIPDNDCFLSGLLSAIGVQLFGWSRSVVRL